ncbi:uncharacterized protein APUU_30628S [Aspergillus puulaauensis]|uniref:CCHC-type domain-containing protein n=1 Tax=Aspergillus puulaauensis TaxID=1220207 RepID=A0A7R8AM92_9EURO|nr:uncharacterized protein APUU_30628S [Aspergillus puulaauensis]BCS22403.1 hypothetical protein APUU_30628S [Aspergillus puulaauensis]
MECYNCRRIGHLARECRRPRVEPRICRRCGQLGHIERDCSAVRQANFLNGVEALGRASRDLAAVAPARTRRGRHDVRPNRWAQYAADHYPPAHLAAAPAAPANPAVPAAVPAAPTVSLRISTHAELLVTREFGAGAAPPRAWRALTTVVVVPLLVMVPVAVVVPVTENGPPDG